MNKLDAHQIAHAFVYKFRVPSTLRKEAEKEIVGLIADLLLEKYQ